MRRTDIDGARVGRVYFAGGAVAADAALAAAMSHAGGATVYPAVGAWRDDNGAVETEPAMVLEVIGDAAQDAADAAACAVLAATDETAVLVRVENGMREHTRTYEVRR